MKIHRRLTTMAAVAAALTIAAQARADTFQDFWLTQGECTGSPCTAPAPISTSLAIEGIIDLNSTGKSATVTFTVPSGGKITTPLYINVNDFGNVSNVTATVNVPGSVFRSDPGQAEDHFGNMNVGAAGGFTICASLCTATSLVFTLTDNSSTLSWANAAAVLMLTTGADTIYGHGFDAAVASYSDAGITTTQYAGFFTTPLPAALPLFATGLGAMGLLGWRRKRKNAAALAAA
jgi:hypothetical protein